MGSDGSPSTEVLRGAGGGRGPGGPAQAMLELGYAWGDPVQATCE